MTIIPTTPVSPAIDSPSQRTSPWEVVAPPAQLVTAADVRLHQRISGTAEGDDYLGMLIDAATDYAQDKLASSLMPQTIVATIYAPDPEGIELPRGPVIAVQSVVDANSVAVTGWTLKGRGIEALLIIPLTVVAQFPISVTYRAGYAATDGTPAVPASLKLAVLSHIGTLYENRESVSDRAKLPVPNSLSDFYRMKSRSRGIA